LSSDFWGLQARKRAFGTEIVMVQESDAFLLIIVNLEPEPYKKKFLRVKPQT
jgi:hypothetical protein